MGQPEHEGEPDSKVLIIINSKSCHIAHRKCQLHTSSNEGAANEVDTRIVATRTKMANIEESVL